MHHYILEILPQLKGIFCRVDEGNNLRACSKIDDPILFVAGCQQQIASLMYAKQGYSCLQM